MGLAARSSRQAVAKWTSERLTEHGTQTANHRHIRMLSDDDAEASTDISAAFAAAVKDTSRAEGARKEAAKEAAKEARSQQKKAENIALSAQGVTPARQAWGYKTAGPEPEPLFEISGILAGALLFLGPVFFFSLAGQDQCVIRPTQEVCLARGGSNPPRQLSQSEQSLQQARQQAALNNAVRRQCLRNAADQEEEDKCPLPMEVVMPRKVGVF